MDGSTLFDMGTPTPLNLPPMIVDSFAGGGGASTGIEAALGRSPDIAINHDPIALQMHEANHAGTHHMTSNVWQVDPDDAIPTGRRVGLAWFSPDCKHHSKAKGGKPRERNIRDLAWVVILWAQRVAPDVIILENVEEFKDWGPLDENDMPDLDRKGQTFRSWVKELRKAGYKVEWKQLRACDFGAPTIRRRLFVIARRDGRPIVWPKPTHGDPASPEFNRGDLLPWRTAADIIDWSLPCPSIFDTSEQIMEKHGLRTKRPLAEATLARIARGVRRFVLDCDDPFIVPSETAGLYAPTMVQTGYGERPGQAPRSLDLNKPMGAMVAGGTKHALVAAFLAQHNAGPRNGSLSGRSADSPVSTLTVRGTQQNIVSAHMISMHGASRRATDAQSPISTITAGGGHAGVVAAFLQKYYGTEQRPDLNRPLDTVTTKDRFGLVTVRIGGGEYAIVDIGMRMLSPREQFNAQGFDEGYEIDTGANGHALTKTEQTRMCGNSVCPPVAAALVRANCAHLTT